MHEIKLIFAGWIQWTFLLKPAQSEMTFGSQHKFQITKKKNSTRDLRYPDALKLQKG